MLAEERFSAILAILSRKRAATIIELADEVGASESTIRRDLSTLALQGKLNKVYGGATIITEDEFISIEKDVLTKQSLNTSEKSKIAAYAATLINDNDFVFIDAGTTTLKLIENLNASKATFVTNGIAHASKLIKKGLKTIVIGGIAKPITEAMIGSFAYQQLSQYNFTKVFMGTNGISVDHGFTTPDFEEALIKTEAVKRSQKAYVLADSSKFDKIYAVSICTLDSATIITEALPTTGYKKFCSVIEVI